ncbi:MAG TPA: 50S ribosomal protein L25 [Tepidisphaeraceae bacterium]|jgi:large subunit ribosomal protein L25|nr:50S ribosomal protein L25 [Tepidisphaeraceae bacterium]
MAGKTANVSVQTRSQLGSRANKRLRDQGLIPGVIYGHKLAVLPITLPKKETVNYLSKGAHVFTLALDGKPETVLVKEVQYDHLGMEVIHVDFSRVDLNERVTVTVPLELRGTPKGAADGGVLQQVLADLEIECVVTDIPEVIKFSVADLALNSVVHVKDIPLPAGAKAVKDGDQIVATVKAIVEAAPADAPEGSAEPEMIGKKKEDEAAEGAAAAPAKK